MIRKEHVVAIVLIAAVVVWYVYNTFEKSSGEEDAIFNVQLDPAPMGPSIFDKLAKQVRESPGKPIDYSVFPPISMQKDGPQVAPGMLDAVMPDAPDEKKVARLLKVLDLVNSGRINDWRMVEHHVKDIRVAAHVLGVQEKLMHTGVTEVAKGMFWAMAKGSNNYEAIKWGIVIGGLALTPQELKEIKILGLHAEFTVYASIMILLNAEEKPDLKEHLFDILKASRQWATIRIVELIAMDPALIKRREVQRDILVEGMKNHEGLAMNVAFLIANAIDLPVFFEEAENDPGIFSAVVELMRSLMLEPEPLGGLTDLNDWENLFQAYLRLVEKRPADMNLIAALMDLSHFLGDEKLEMDQRNVLYARVARWYTERFSVEAVRAGLADEFTRMRALKTIVDSKVKELAPDLVKLFEENPDPNIIDALGAVGGEKELKLMLAKIPGLVDLEARKNKPMSKTNVLGPGVEKNFMLASLVGHLHKLANPEALALIKTAGRDYDPFVRLAACKAIAKLPADKIDDELKQILKERMQDPMPYVVAKAKETAGAIGLTPDSSKTEKKADGEPVEMETK